MDFFRDEKTFGSPFAAFLANRNNKQESERIFEQAEADLEARGVKNASEDQIFNEARIIYNSEKIRKDHARPLEVTCSSLVDFTRTLYM